MTPDMDMPSGEPIPDEKLNRLINVIVNVWFRKWRSRRMSDADWHTCIGEANQIIEQGRQYPIAMDLIKALLHELERRWQKENRRK